MNLLELHILQSFPVTCLNRDDVGAPKTAMFGGVPRARVSSQCWKRAIREQAQQLHGDYFAGTRTRYVVGQFQQRFEAAGKSPEIAKVLANAAAEATGKLDSPEKGNVKTLLFFSPAELDAVVDELLAQEPDEHAAILVKDEKNKKADGELKKMAKKAAKSMANKVKDAADIAIFGRMVADDHSLTVEGAGLFSHALSTHRADNQVDFFSAVDDNKPDENDDAGAGHIGTLEYNSATYYRCVVLNLDLLRGQHLAHFSDDEFDSVLGAFIRAAILAVPNARKNSMFGHTMPHYVLGLRRQGHPLSLANAFEAPVHANGKGFSQNSVQQLQAHYQQLKQTYGLDTAVEVALPDVGLDSFIASLLKAEA